MNKRLIREFYDEGYADAKKNYPNSYRRVGK